MIGKYGDRSSGSTVMPFRLLESPPTLGESTHPWRVGGPLEGGHGFEKSPYSPKVGGLCVLFFQRDASISGKGNTSYPYCMNLGAFRCRVACS